MSAKLTADIEVTEKVGQVLDRLLAARGEEQQEAARELSRLGVWSRGSVRTRGRLDVPAPDRLPPPDRWKQLFRQFKAADKDLRRELALAFGEWGTEAAARELVRCLRAEADEETQLYCITALRTIGGPVAAEGLRWALLHGSDAVRDAAIAAVEELATGGRQEETEAIPPPPREPGENGSGRRRGAIDTHGSVATGAGRDASGRLAGALDRVRGDEAASPYLRRRAAELLPHLKR